MAAADLGPEGALAVQVGEAVLVGVPAPIGQVQPSQEGHRLVHHNQLLVVGPEEDDGGDVVGMAHHLKGEEREGTLGVVEPQSPVAVQRS